MKKSLSVCLVICFISMCAFAQIRPFDSFEKAVTEQRGGFNGNKENLSIIFNQERIRLGEDFEAELWKYLGEDVEKHYWSGVFLQSKSYLHENTPLPELALKVWQNALALLGDKQDTESFGDRFKISVMSAILSKKLGNDILAKKFKMQSENITALGFDTQTYFPAIRDFEKCLYYAIGTSEAGKCVESENELPQEQIVAGGVINGKAVKLANPKYPKAARKRKISGEVWVKVLIDTDGKIISAEAVKGPPELFAASVEAAKKSIFTPTTLSGKPVKVSGLIVYKFVR